MLKKGLELHCETLDRVKEARVDVGYLRREYDRTTVLRNISKNFKPEVPPPQRKQSRSGRPGTRRCWQRARPLPQNSARLPYPAGSARSVPHRLPRLYLANSARLQAWLAIDRPSLLLVNGGGTNSASVDVNIVSAGLANTVSAGLVNTLLAAATIQPQVVSHAVFCSQHKQFASDLYGCATEMAMSLLLQLIHRYARFSEEAIAEIDHRTNPRDIMSVCDTLEACVRRPSADTTLFIVFDGIDCFSDPTNRTYEIIQVVTPAGWAVKATPRHEPQAPLRRIHTFQIHSSST